VILCKSLTVDADDVILEQPAKLLLFGLACDTPIRSEHKPGHAWNVEILLQQLVKEILLLSGRHVGTNDAERRVAKRADELGRARIRYCSNDPVSKLLNNITVAVVKTRRSVTGAPR